MNAFGGGVLPHCSEAAVGLVGRRSITGFDVRDIESKLSGDLLGPVSNEVSLRRVLHREDSLELAVAEVSVLVTEAFG